VDVVGEVDAPQARLLAGKGHDGVIRLPETETVHDGLGEYMNRYAYWKKRETGLRGERDFQGAPI
jgi:hypothetical protein